MAAMTLGAIVRISFFFRFDINVSKIAKLCAPTYICVLYMYICMCRFIYIRIQFDLNRKYFSQFILVPLILAKSSSALNICFYNWHGMVWYCVESYIKFVRTTVAFMYNYITKYRHTIKVNETAVYSLKALKTSLPCLR